MLKFALGSLKTKKLFNTCSFKDIKPMKSQNRKNNRKTKIGCFFRSNRFKHYNRKQPIFCIFSVAKKSKSQPKSEFSVSIFYSMHNRFPFSVIFSVLGFRCIKWSFSIKIRCFLDMFSLRCRCSGDVSNEYFRWFLHSVVSKKSF